MEQTDKHNIGPENDWGKSRKDTTKSYKRDDGSRSKNKKRGSKRDHNTYNKTAPQFAVIYGTHAAQEAWCNPDRHIESIFITERSEKAYEAMIADERFTPKTIKRPRPQIVSRQVLDKKSGGGVHQGIVLECDPLAELSVEDLIIKAYKKENATMLILDQVTDPHNIGAILRSASAFGVSGIIMQRRHAPDLSGTLAKTACGAADHIDVAYEVNLSRALGALQDAGYIGIALDERGDDIALFDQKASKKVLVLGAEGKGIRPKIQEQCDKTVRLPTQGMIQSLNVSNAAAVSLYALMSSELDDK